MTEAFILTDAHNNTSVVMLASHIFSEATRMTLLAPISVDRWVRTVDDWVRRETYSWPGDQLRA